MTELADTMRTVRPRQALREIAEAIPRDCMDNLTIIGSLAAGFHFEDLITGMAIRTKDADGLISPRIEAVEAGRAITERLFQEGWRFRSDGEFGEPGTTVTADRDLPAVRLYPPDGSEWFIELLTVPESPEDLEKNWVRLITSGGHFGLPSFGYLAIAGYTPDTTELGIRIARPEMMALANMLEHPIIRPDLMSGLIAGRKIKRSNKDLGRVLAISLLASRRDEDALLGWPTLWQKGLQDILPQSWEDKCLQAGSGIREMLEIAHELDLDEAHHTCVNGLLASVPPTMEQLRIAGDRLLVDAIEPLEDTVR